MNDKQIRKEDVRLDDYIMGILIDVTSNDETCDIDVLKANRSLIMMKIEDQIKKERVEAITKVENRILDIMDEFSTTPEQCLSIIGEHISLSQHYRDNPNLGDPELQGM